MPKCSSFLYGEQFCSDELNRIHSAHKRHSNEAFGEVLEEKYMSTNYYKVISLPVKCVVGYGEKINHVSSTAQNSKTTGASQSMDDGSTSTCSDDEKDYAIHTDDIRKPFSPQTSITTSPTLSGTREPSLTSPIFGFPSMAFFKSTQSRRTDFYPYHQQHHHPHPQLPPRGNLTGQAYFNNFKPPAAFSHARDEENDTEDGNSGIGSELLVAAYNVNILFKLPTVSCVITSQIDNIHNLGVDEM